MRFQDEDVSLGRTIMRYMLVSFVLVFRSVSEKIIKRVPRYDHLVSYHNSELTKVIVILNLCFRFPPNC